MTERRIISFIATALWPVMLAVAWNAPNAGGWVGVVLCMILFLLCMGKLITKRWARCLIKERNLMSLSRFKIILWIVIVLSAYLMIPITFNHYGIYAADQRF